MRSTKLKKKLRANDVIFPAAFLRKEPAQREQQSPKGDKRSGRRLSKSKSQQKHESAHARSLSASHKLFQPKTNAGQRSVPIKDLVPVKPLEKRLKRGSSAIEISKIYYDNLEKRLQKECELVLQQAHPKEQLKTYNLQSISKNLLLLRQNQPPRVSSRKSISKPSIESVSSKREVSESEASISDKLSAFKKDIEQFRESKKDEESYIDISLSGKSIEASEELLYADNFRHHNSLMAELFISQASQQSLFKSHVNADLVEALANVPIYFFSPKFSIKYTTYFKIVSLSILINEDKHYEFRMFFRIYNETLFQRVLLKPAQERKALEHRARKGHIKKMQVMREKLKERVLSYFLREHSEELVIDFYQDLIVYLEHFLILEKSYRGLAFADTEESMLELRNHERIFEMLRINRSFHFILKLNYTFYLVKVTFSPQNELRFTFIYDFTTHNAGDQLAFTHPAPLKLRDNKNDSRVHRVFLRVIEEFTEQIAAEWRCEYATNKEIEEKEDSAKIAQISAVSIEKWDDPEVRKIRNINKSYHLTGGLTNFFQHHDQFDYGFLARPHHLLTSGRYAYSLDELHKHVPVYVYPHTFLYLELTQVQKEMLLIPHIPEQLQQGHAEKCINSFFRREVAKHYRKQHQHFTMFIGRQQIRMRQRLDLLDIFLHSLSNLRCHRLTIPVTVFPSYSPAQHDRLDMKRASAHVARFIGCYSAEKSFLYSKLTRKEERRLVIYYKGIQKLERQYAFLTLYGLPLHQIIEFKIFIFRIGREFIIRLDSIEWVSELNLRELIANLLELIKTIYFKNLILEEARKSKKRRLDSLESFLKKHGKSYVNQVRSKKKLDEQVKRRMLKLATLKENNISTLVYENIITDYFRAGSGKEFLITIRYLPTEEFKEQNEWKHESVEICVHKEGSINYFKHVASMRDLVQSVSQGRMSLEHIDFRHVHHFFKEVRDRIKEIVQSSHRSMSFLINHLKHFLIYNYQLPLPHTHPFKFKLLHNIFYETRTSVNPNDEIASQISIEYDMEKQVLLSSNSNLIFLPYLGTEHRQQVSTNFSFTCRKPVNHPYQRHVSQDYIIEIIDIFRKSEDYKLLKEYNLSTREVWVTDRATGCRSVLSEWEVDFLSVIDFGQYNRRLFRRLLSTLRPAL